MFDGIVLHKQPETGAALDAGLLAETLLFFQNVTILLDFGNVTSLIKSIGPDIFFDLIEQGLIKATYSANDMGTLTDTINGIQQHSQIFYSFAGSSPTKSKQRKRQHIEAVLEKAGVPRFRMREFYKKFTSSIKFYDKSEMIPKEDGMSVFIQQDMTSQTYFNNAAKEVIDFYAPSYFMDKSFSFRAVGDDKKFFLMDELDYEDLNKHVRSFRAGEKKTEITPALIAQTIFSAKLDLFVGAHYGFDISTGEVSRRINELKLNNLYQKISKDLYLPSLFQERVIGNIGNIRSAINSGERTFKEFMPLLNKSDKFKTWLKGLHTDDNLIDEYCKEVSRQGWADKLPAKNIRFGICTGLGLLSEALMPSGIGTAAGLTIGAADTYLLDKMFKGWRPSTFVSEVQNFLPEE